MNPSWCVWWRPCLRALRSWRRSMCSWPTTQTSVDSRWSRIGPGQRNWASLFILVSMVLAHPWSLHQPFYSSRVFSSRGISTIEPKNFISFCWSWPQRRLACLCRWICSSCISSTKCPCCLCIYYWACGGVTPRAIWAWRMKKAWNWEIRSSSFSILDRTAKNMPRWSWPCSCLLERSSPSWVFFWFTISHLCTPSTYWYYESKPNLMAGLEISFGCSSFLALPRLRRFGLCILGRP